MARIRMQGRDGEWLYILCLFTHMYSQSNLLMDRIWDMRDRSQNDSKLLKKLVL